MSESNCRGWAIVSSAKKGSIDNIVASFYSHPVSNRVVLTTSSYSQNRFNGFHPRDTDKALKRLEEIQCERRGHPIETG